MSRYLSLIAGLFLCLISPAPAETPSPEAMTAAKNLVTTMGVADQYRARFPKVDWQTHLCVTEDRGVLCGGGIYASTDLALYIVEKLCGREVAIGCAKSLVLQMPRTHQTSFALLPIGRDHGDPVVRRGQDWLQQHFREEIDLDDLAAELALTPRTFLRRFKAATGETPLAYLQRLRTDAAKHLLEEHRLSVQEISLAVGYEDVAFFRNLFKRHAGVSPSSYRERYGRTASV